MKAKYCFLRFGLTAEKSERLDRNIDFFNFVVGKKENESKVDQERKDHKEQR